MTEAADVLMTDQLLAGLAHHRAGRLHEAEEAYRAVLAENAAQPNALFLYGALLASRDAPSATQILRQAAALRPEDPESRLLLGNLAHRAGDLAGAMRWWQAARACDPGHRGAALNLANALRAAGHWHQAADICRSALAATQAAHTAAPLWEALAAALLAGGLFDSALLAADSALDLDPSLAEAWLIRGTCLARCAGSLAIASLQRALALNPGSARAHLHLGNALLDQNRPDAAEPLLRQAVRLAPDLPEAWTSLGFFEASQHLLDAAIACHERAIAAAPDFAPAHLNLSAALMLVGEWDRGWAEYEWRKADPLFRHCYWQSDRPQWRGEPVQDRTLLLFCEQGFGDAIMGARFIRLLAAAGARIVLVAAPSLLPLLGRLPGVVATVARAAPLSGACLAEGEVVPAYDVWADLLSLPGLFGITAQYVPFAHSYLSADPASVRRWRARLPGGRTIGLAWAGNPAHSNDHRRSMPAATLAPCLAVPGLNFLSLQLGAAGEVPPGVQDAAPYLTDFAETAAAIACCDAVLTVDTAVAHLAGALGVPCLLLLPHVPEWRWMLHGQRTPWYASVRLLRQQRPGDWSAPVAKAAAALQRWAESSTPEP